MAPALAPALALWPPRSMVDAQIPPLGHDTTATAAVAELRAVAGERHDLLRARRRGLVVGGMAVYLGPGF